MGYRRYNVSTTSVNFTGQTSTARVYSNQLFIGENDRAVEALSAKIVATCTMTGATMKTQWQGSSDGTNWDDLAVNATNGSVTAFITGAAATTATNIAQAPEAAYGYKYARCSIIFTSTTAGTTNDALIIGLNYRQL